MARHMSLYGSVIMVVLVLVSGTGLSAVMMPNASFEESPVDGVLPGWPSPYGGVPFGGPEVRLSNEKAVDGDYSVRIETAIPTADTDCALCTFRWFPAASTRPPYGLSEKRERLSSISRFWNEKGQRIYVGNRQCRGDVDLGSDHSQGKSTASMPQRSRCCCTRTWPMWA